jgi:endonuclease-8
MHFSGGLVLRTHMRMHGSWHIYRPGERWRARKSDMRVLVATADFEAVGFNIPVAEFITSRDLAKHEVLSRLGPDALDPGFDATKPCGDCAAVVDADRRGAARPADPGGPRHL